MAEQGLVVEIDFGKFPKLRDYLRKVSDSNRASQERFMASVNRIMDAVGTDNPGTEAKKGIEKSSEGVTEDLKTLIDGTGALADNLTAANGEAQQVEAQNAADLTKSDMSLGA